MEAWEDALCPFFVHLAYQCCVMLLHQVLYVLCYAGIFDFILKSLPALETITKLQDDHAPITRIIVQLFH